MSKYIELAKKLKNLSEKGVDGEAVNAYEALTKLLKKHGITLEELEGDKVSRVWFKYHKHRRLFIQIAGMVMDGVPSIWERKDKRYQYAIDCTVAQEIEIREAFSFYAARYEQDLELFYSAFVQRNNIFPASGGVQMIGEMSPEEQERMRQMMMLAQNLPAHIRLKQLEAGK